MENGKFMKFSKHKNTENQCFNTIHIVIHRVARIVVLIGTWVVIHSPLKAQLDLIKLD